MMCGFLFIKYFSSVLPIEFVWLSCHTVDLELLSMAICVPRRLLNFSISSTFAVFMPVSPIMARYMLAAKIPKLLYLSSRTV